MPLTCRTAALLAAISLVLLRGAAVAQDPLTVDAVTAAQSGNVAVMKVLGTKNAGTVTFAGNSTFITLVVEGADGVNAAASVTTDDGHMSVDADVDNDGTGRLTVASTKILSSAEGDHDDLTVKAAEVMLSGELRAQGGTVTLLPSNGRTAGLGSGSLNVQLDGQEPGSSWLMTIHGLDWAFLVKIIRSTKQSLMNGRNKQSTNSDHCQMLLSYRILRLSADMKTDLLR